MRLIRENDFLYVIDVDYSGLEYKRQVIACQGDFGSLTKGIIRSKIFRTLRFVKSRLIKEQAELFPTA